MNPDEERRAGFRQNHLGDKIIRMPRRMVVASQLAITIYPQYMASHALHGNFMLRTSCPHVAASPFVSMNALVEDTAKYFMLMLLPVPFAVLATDAAGKIHHLMPKAALGAMALSWTVVFLVGGFESRPNVADIFAWAWVAWPLLLLVAKGWNTKLSWGSLWMSVPVMSWYLVTMVIQFRPLANDVGGGLGAGLAMLAGWFYMVIPFAALSLIFLSGRGLWRIFSHPRKGRGPVRG